MVSLLGSVYSLFLFRGMNIYSGFYCFLRRGQIQNTAATELSTAKKLATTARTTANTESAILNAPASAKDAATALSRILAAATKYATAIPNRAKKLLPYFRQKAKPFAANVLLGMNRHASARNTTPATAASAVTELTSATDTEHAQPTEPAKRPARARIISQARPVTNARKNTTSMMQAQNVSKTATRHADRQASSSIRQATVTVTTQVKKEYVSAIHAG